MIQKLSGSSRADSFWQDKFEALQLDFDQQSLELQKSISLVKSLKQDIQELLLEKQVLVSGIQQGQTADKPVINEQLWAQLAVLGVQKPPSGDSTLGLDQIIALMQENQFTLERLNSLKSNLHGNPT